MFSVEMDWQDDQRSLQNNDAIPVPICEHIHDK